MGLSATALSPHGFRHPTPVAPSAARAEDAAFSHALVALAAKLAVVDGAPNSAEYAAFTRLFVGDDVDAGKLKSLFMKHVSDGSSAVQYARQVLNATYGQAGLHFELVERLLRLAVADGPLNAAECEWLRAVAAIFQIEGEHFRNLVARHTMLGGSPYEVLGIASSVSDDELRSHYMSLVQKLHPDRYLAAGATEATIAMLSDRLALVNAAYHDICAKRAKRTSRVFSSAGTRRNHKGARAVAA